MKIASQIGGFLLFILVIVLLTLLVNRIVNKPVQNNNELDNLKVKYITLKVKYDSLENVLVVSDKYYQEVIKSKEGNIYKLKQKVYDYEKGINDIGGFTNVQLMDSITGYYARRYNY